MHLGSFRYSFGNMLAWFWDVTTPLDGMHVARDLATMDEIIINTVIKPIDAGVGVISLQSTKKLIVADAAFLDLGRYPIFRAKETTFSLKVALSMNTSLETILALYEVI